MNRSAFSQMLYKCTYVPYQRPRDPRGPSDLPYVPSWLSACVVLLYAVVFVPFPFRVWEGMWNSIVSVPDHCFLSIHVCIMTTVNVIYM